MEDEDEKLLRTWTEIAKEASAEQDSRRLNDLVEELHKALDEYWMKTHKVT